MSKIELKENLKKYSNLDECPIRNIISRFSGKWPVIILCILSENECTRFNQIQKAIPDISPKVLSDTLKNLETDGIIKRIVYGEVPPRVEYSLTKLGLSLMPYINRNKIVKYRLSYRPGNLRKRPLFFIFVALECIFNTFGSKYITFGHFITFRI